MPRAKMRPARVQDQHWDRDWTMRLMHVCYLHVRRVPLRDSLLRTQNQK